MSNDPYVWNYRLSTWANESAKAAQERVSARITAAFRKRDALYSAGDFTSPEVTEHERSAATAQLELAALVEEMDPARAKRLRDMAEGRA